MTARRLKVAFVMPGVGVVPRGAEAFVVDLCEALGRRGDFDVLLYCRGEAPVPHRRIRALPRDQKLLRRLYGASRFGRKVLDTLFLDPLNLEWATAALAAFPGLWRGGYDLVVMEGGLMGGWLCRLLRRLRGVPWIDLAHGLSPKWEGAFARQHPDRVVTFTQVGAKRIQALAPRARIQVIPHGVDLEAFRPGLEPVPLDLPRPRFLAVGAVDEDKRMELTVEAVARLGQGSLLVLGEGPRGADLDRLAVARLGEGRYHRTVVPRATLPHWYAAADVFTLPSRAESFGLAYLEAMACGLPCVAPEDPVRRELIGEAGIYCPVEQAVSYATALREAVERDWGEVPRRRAEGFPFSRTVEAYARLFHDVAP